MEKVILDSGSLSRTISRLAHEIIESQQSEFDDVLIVGIKTRGYDIANLLGKKIHLFENVHVPIEPLDITFYRDDLVRRHVDPKLNEEINFDVNNKTIILVDDVLFTGRTVRAALDAIVKKGRPKKIKLVALIDRGHRELPIRADFVGKNIPTAANEVVKVYIDELDGKNEVVIKN